MLRPRFFLFSDPFDSNTYKKKKKKEKNNACQNRHSINAFLPSIWSMPFEKADKTKKSCLETRLCALRAPTKKKKKRKRE